MSDPYGPRDDWAQPRGRPDDDWARDAAHAPGAAHTAGTPGQPPSDAWAEVYGWQHPPKIAGPRESLRGPARALSVLLPLIAVMEIFNAWDFFGRMPATVQSGFHYWVGINYFYPVNESPRHAVSLVLFIATVALFIVWQYKHAKNAEILGQHGGLGPGWAIGGWFIPLAHFILPVVQLVQSSAASDPPPDRFRGESRTSLIVWWALVFHLSTLEVTLRSSDPSTGELSNTVNGLLALLSIPAAALAVIMIWQLTKRQETALDARES